MYSSISILAEHRVRHLRATSSQAEDADHGNATLGGLSLSLSLTISPSSSLEIAQLSLLHCRHDEYVGSGSNFHYNEIINELRTYY